MNVTHIGLDLAKNVFALHGVDEHARPVMQMTMTRSKLLRFFAKLEPCTVGMEACASAHYWSRQLESLGHRTRLMQPRFVTPYRKDDKNDHNDAEAICEAMGRPSMRFVGAKSLEQQGILVVHRARALLSEQRVALMNHTRGLLSEFGVVMPRGAAALRRGLAEVLSDEGAEVPALAREVFAELSERLAAFERRLEDYDRCIESMARDSEAAKRVMAIPGIGPVTATALLATAGDMTVFANGRQFTAWLGLVPRHYGTGGKNRNGRITKRGDAYVRTLLIHGARAALRTAHRRDDRLSRWAQSVQARRGTNKAAVALAAKHARVIWAILTHDTPFEPNIDAARAA